MMADDACEMRAGCSRALAACTLVACDSMLAKAKSRTTYVGTRIAYCMYVATDTAQQQPGAATSEQALSTPDRLNVLTRHYRTVNRLS